MRFANEFGFCEINSFPGCAQLAVSNNAFIYPDHRGKGLGKINHRLRISRMKQMGYDAVVATVVVGNAKEEAILKENGWSHVFTFQSKVTEKFIGLWVRKI